MSELFWRSMTPMKCFKVLSLSRVHRGFCFRVVVIISQNMKYAMNKQ
jgi:hypothetical protein